MEKLFKLVCANFALKSRRPLSCHEKLENRVDDANIMFIGMYIEMVLSKVRAVDDLIYHKSKSISELSKFLNISSDNVNSFFEMFNKTDSKRFKIKKGLIINGINHENANNK